MRLPLLAFMLCLLAAAPARAEEAAIPRMQTGDVAGAKKSSIAGTRMDAAPDTAATTAEGPVPGVKIDAGTQFTPPLRADLGLTKAEGQLAEGKYVQALATAEAVLVRRPADADAMTYAAYALMQIGQTEKADEYIKRALKMDPRHLGANTYRAEMLLAEGDMARALEQAQVIRIACANQDCPELDRVQSALNAAAMAKKQPAQKETGE